jgi:O-antigen/teichoic acid export membrane protein
MLVITIAFSVAFGDLRGLILATHSSAWFSFISASPNIILLSIVGLCLVIVPQGLTAELVRVPLFFATYGLALAFAVSAYVGRVGALSMRANELVRSFRELVPFGALTWVPAVLQAALVLFVLRWVGSVDNGSDATGVFATAMTLSVMATTPLSLAVPILFKWWLPLDDVRRRQEVVVAFLVATVVLAGIWLILYRWEEAIIRAAFGPEFVQYAGLYSVLFLSTAPQVALKVFGVYCNARGRPAVAAIVEAGRAIVILGAVVVMGATLRGSVYAWVIGEFASLVLCAAVFLLLPTKNSHRA